jgi:hypothetical protein
MSNEIRRFTKRVYNDDQGVRRLGFYALATPSVPLVSFDLNVLEDIKMVDGELAVARQIAIVLNTVLDGNVTPSEIEYAVEDI